MARRHFNMNKLTRGEKVFQAINTVFLIFMLIITLYPFWYIIVASVSSNTEVLQANGKMLWPRGFNVSAYKEVLKYASIWTGYKNTIFVLIVGTLISIILTAIGGYFLSRKNVFFQKYIAIAIVITMYFSGGIIPFYFTVKDLGLDGSLWSLILPTAISTYNLIIMRTAFAAIPDSLEESAKIDGARHFTILFRIMLPLCIPTVAVLILYYAVGYWNSWFNASLFLTDRGTFPLQLILREIILYNTGDANSAAASVDKEDISETLQYATIIVSTVPILCIYPFLQKYFAKGVMVGAIKG